MIRVVGTPPTANERAALTERSRQERRQVAEVFEAERAQPGSRLPWGGILVYCSLPESTRPHGEMRERFTAFDYPTGVGWVPAVGSFGSLINSMSGGDTTFFRSTISIMGSGEYHGALLPGTASGFRLYAFRCACPPHLPVPNAVLSASAPPWQIIGSSIALADARHLRPRPAGPWRCGALSSGLWARVARDCRLPRCCPRPPPAVCGQHTPARRSLTALGVALAHVTTWVTKAPPS